MIGNSGSGPAFAVIGLSARHPFSVPGNSQVCGRMQRQY